VFKPRVPPRIWIDGRGTIDALSFGSISAHQRAYGERLTEAAAKESFDAAEQLSKRIVESLVARGTNLRPQSCEFSTLTSLPSGSRSGVANSNRSNCSLPRSCS
jgi:hypothetical protein